MQTTTELIVELRNTAKTLFRLGDLSKAATITAAAIKIERLEKELSDLKKVNEKPNMTNHEKIKQMTADELAAFIEVNKYGCGIPTDCQSANYKECIQIWLEQEVQE